MDNVYSKYMTGDRYCFLSFKEKYGGLLTFGNNDETKIEGISIIGKNNFAKTEDYTMWKG